MLQNETYLGFVKYKGELHPGLHPPLVSREHFERSQQVCRDARLARQQPMRHRFYLLSGLVRCSQCGYTMRGIGDQRSAGRLQRYYRDAGRERGIVCDQGRIRAELLEERVDHIMTRIQLPHAWQERIALLAQATPDVERLELERRMLRARGRRLRKLFLRGDISESQYVQQHQQLTRQVNHLTDQQHDIDAEIRWLVGDFRQLWENMHPEERKRLIQVVIRAIYVRHKRVERIEFNRPFEFLFPKQTG